MEKLRLTNPMKYENLMSYYRSYGHLLAAATTDGGPTTSVQADSEAARAPSSYTNSISGSGIRSPNATSDAALPTQTLRSHVENLSTIYPPLNLTDPTNYQPTPDVSSYAPESSQVGKESNHEIADYSQSLSRLTHNLQNIQLQPSHHDAVGADIFTLGSDQVQYDPAQRLTPVKFSSPHVKAVFSAGGLVAKVDAKSPMDGQSGK